MAADQARVFGGKIQGQKPKTQTAKKFASYRSSAHPNDMSKQPSRKRGNTSCGESSERECSEKKARVDSEPPRLSKEQAEYLGLVSCGASA